MSIIFGLKRLKAISDGISATAAVQGVFTIFSLPMKRISQRFKEGKEEFPND